MKLPHQATCTREHDPDENESAICGAPCRCWCTDSKHMYCICEDCYDETEEQKPCE